MTPQISPTPEYRSYSYPVNFGVGSTETHSQESPTPAPDSWFYPCKSCSSSCSWFYPVPILNPFPLLPLQKVPPLLPGEEEEDEKVAAIAKKLQEKYVSRQLVNIHEIVNI